MIKTEHLKKCYGNLVAVDDLNLDIKKGEFYVLLGPNAAGKTTTLKMLTGLLNPTEGQIWISEKNLLLNPIEAKKKISFIPDFPFIYDKLTGREFLDFISDIHGLEEDRANKKIKELQDYFQLSQDSDTLLENYSHGMRQRLVFCSAILTEPHVLIIDEPMVGLDPRTARLVKDILKQLSRDGCTLLVSTHTLSFAEELADRIGIIYKGKILVEGSPQEIKSYAKSSSMTLEQAFLEITKEVS